jgi:NitT/TauT family transport system substrate-binding protein
MSLFRRVILLVCVLSLAACGAGETPAPGGEQSGKPMKQATLMLNWVPYGEHAAFYYGLEKGFFAEEGIELTIQPGGGSGKTVQAVAAGQVPFGYADSPALIKAVAAGAPVKSIGSFVQTTPSAVEFFATQGIKTPADLKGKSVAVTPGDAVFQTFPAFLAANGMTVEDVELVNVDASGKIAALIEGKADTLIGFFHDQAPTIEDKSGSAVAVLRYADWGVNFLSSGLLASNDTLAKDPELVRAFLRASIRSWEEAARDPAGAVEAMSKRAEKAPPATVLAKQWEKTLSLMHTTSTAGMRPSINVEADWQATIDILARYSDLKNPGKPSDYWDASFAPSAN